MSAEPPFARVVLSPPWPIFFLSPDRNSSTPAPSRRAPGVGVAAKAADGSEPELDHQRRATFSVLATPAQRIGQLGFEQTPLLRE